MRNTAQSHTGSVPGVRQSLAGTVPSSGEDQYQTLQEKQETSPLTRINKLHLMDPIRLSAKPTNSTENQPSSSKAKAPALSQHCLWDRTATPWPCHLTPKQNPAATNGDGLFIFCTNKGKNTEKFPNLPQLGPQQQSSPWRLHFPSPQWPSSRLWMNIQGVDSKSWFGDRTKGSGFLDPGFDK